MMTSLKKMHLKQFLIAFLVYISTGAVYIISKGDELQVVAAPGGVILTLLGFSDYHSLDAARTWFSLAISAALVTAPVLFRSSVIITLVAGSVILLSGLHCLTWGGCIGSETLNANLKSTITPIFVLGMLLANRFRRQSKDHRPWLPSVIVGLLPIVMIVLFYDVLVEVTSRQSNYSGFIFFSFSYLSTLLLISFVTLMEIISYRQERNVSSPTILQSSKK